VLERFTTRLVTLPVTIREGLRTLAVAMLWVGGRAVGLVVGLPKLMAALHNYAATSDSVWAGLIHAVGLVPDAVCGLSEVSCGTQNFVNLSFPRPPGDPFVAVAASILAVVRFGLAKSPGEGTAGEGGGWRSCSALSPRPAALGGADRDHRGGTDRADELGRRPSSGSRSSWRTGRGSTAS
jgi:hypothetical protein